MSPDFARIVGTAPRGFVDAMRFMKSRKPWLAGQWVWGLFFVHDVLPRNLALCKQAFDHLAELHATV
jgi:hypothetical protein